MFVLREVGIGEYTNGGVLFFTTLSSSGKIEPRQVSHAVFSFLSVAVARSRPRLKLAIWYQVCTS